MAGELTALLVDEVAYGDPAGIHPDGNGVCWKCGSDDVYPIYCHRHLLDGYGMHTVGWGCYNAACDAGHWFLEPDWSSPGCRAYDRRWALPWWRRWLAR